MLSRIINQLIEIKPGKQPPSGQVGSFRLVGDLWQKLQQQAVQRRSLRSIQVREQLQFELLACLPQLRQKVAPADGQPDDMPSTVIWMLCPLYQAALLKDVDDADEIARIDTQAPAQLLLR